MFYRIMLYKLKTYTTMDKKVAEQTKRKIVKDRVRKYFSQYAYEEFNWELYGSNIIKRELYHYSKSIKVIFDALSNGYIVIDLDNKILAK